MTGKQKFQLVIDVLGVGTSVMVLITRVMVLITRWRAYR